MTEARSVLPTDILALVATNGRGYVNEAWPRERAGASGEPALPIGAALEKTFTFMRGRGAWISVERQRMRGLVGARRRGGRQAWEVDYLIDATHGSEVIPGLIECAVAEVGRAGAEKLFLRLATDSDLLSFMREAGFVVCQEETLYRAATGFRATAAHTLLRPLVPADSYLLYRLYNAQTPEAVRRVEAASYNEWHAAQERRWLNRGVQLVREHDGKVDACVSAARLPQGIVIDLLADASVLDQATGLIEAAVHAVGGEPAPLIVLCSAASGLCGRLETAGFEPQGAFVTLVKRTVRPIPLPKLTPAVVKPAISA